MKRDPNRHAIACTAALLALSIGSAAHAHDPGLSSLTVVRGPAGGSFTLEVDDAALPVPRRAPSGSCDASSVLGLALGGRELAFSARCSARDGHTVYQGDFTVPHAGLMTITVPLLDELARGHRSFARALDARGKVTDQRLLARGDRWQLAVDAPRRSGLGVLALVALLATAMTFTLLSRSMRRRTAPSACTLGRTPGL